MRRVSQVRQLASRRYRDRRLQRTVLLHVPGLSNFGGDPGGARGQICTSKWARMCGLLSRPTPSRGRGRNGESSEVISNL